MKKALIRGFAFGEFELDTLEQVLWQGESPLDLRPKLFDLLTYLLERRGKLVGKDELIKGVWGELSLGAPDNPAANLNVSLSSLRKLLNDDAENPRYIETVPRRGYRFIAPVEVIGAEAVQLKNSPVAVALPLQLSPMEWTVPNAPLPTLPASHLGQWLKLKWKVALVLVALGLLTASGWRALRRDHTALAQVVSGAMRKKSVEGAAALPTALPTVNARILALNPAEPLATIGDQRLRLTGLGFQSGQSVTVVFPSGGAGMLTGEQIQPLTSQSCDLLFDFNGNPGTYSLRVNLPTGTNSPWFNFTAAAYLEAPQLTSLAVSAAVTGAPRILATGEHFQQNVQVLLESPGGKLEVLGPPQVQRGAPTQFEVRLDKNAPAGLYKMQARNSSGCVSNTLTFRLPAA